MPWDSNVSRRSSDFNEKCYENISQSYHEESEVIRLMVYLNFCLESRRPKAWGYDIDILEGSFHMCSGKHDVHLHLRGGIDSKIGIYL